MTHDTKVSPMMVQWHSCKAQAKDAILFFRLGDFYEAFYEDAQLISKELDITLTKRQDIPMAGVPFHSCESYLDRLVAKGYCIAIAEQMEDPKVTKGLVKREIVRTITPGTVITSSLLSEKENNFLCCLTQINSVFGLAILDVTTADFRVIELEDIKQLTDELFRLRPSELILSEKCYGRHQAMLDDVFVQFHPALKIKAEWEFDHQHACDFLMRHFKVQSLDGFGLKGMVAAINAAGTLLTYVSEELNIQIGHIVSVKRENLATYMTIDRATQRHLELVESLHEGKGQRSLLWLLDETATPMGARLLKQWLLHPLLDLTAIRERQDGVMKFLNQESVEKLPACEKSMVLTIPCQNPHAGSVSGGSDILENVGKPPLGQGASKGRFCAVGSFATGSQPPKLRETLSEIRDLERLIMRIETGYATPRDLVSLRHSLAHVEPLSTVAQERLSAPPEVLLKITAAIVDNPPLRLSEGNIFKTGYHPELDELRALQSDSHAWLARYQTELKESTGIKTLKVSYTKAFGYYIEVSKGQVDNVPSTFQRRQTLVNAERFITPELKEFEHKMLTAEERTAHLESELFHTLRKEVASFALPIRELATKIARIDCLQALAKVAKEHNYVRPEIDQSSTFQIEEGRHPVIEALLKEEAFIPNDVTLDNDKNRLLLITGPNMAGKSTYIRQVALIAIMAQMGSFVPAKRAHIGLIDKVFSRIGASDDLSRGQSTFMVEMIETANILHNATSRSLVILDEIGRGTSTYDGISIAWSVAEYLLTNPEHSAKTLFATHYWELTELEAQIPGAVNYNIAVQETDEGIVFLRKIVKGGTDKSYGIHVARLAGLPPAVIKRAHERLHSLEKQAGRTPTKPAAKQMDFFESPVVSELKKLDPHAITPLQALQKLSEWKAKL